MISNINSYIDHTLLKPEASPQDIEKLCKEAIENDFYAVCVNSCYAKEAAEYLKDSPVQLAVVVGFPLGASSTESKVFETIDACKNGATEIDMVLNIGHLKAGNLSEVGRDIRAVVRAAAEHNAIVKVIIETCLLDDLEIKTACHLLSEAGAAFAKTSTGFSTGGAKVEDVRLMRESCPETVKIKASGGIRDLETALAMIDAGAERLGVSAGLAIMEAARSQTSSL